MRIVVGAIIGGTIVLYLLVMEAIDMAGRVDYVRQHFPRLLAWAEHRAWYRVLLIVTAAMIGGLWYELLSSQPQTITARISPPPPPTIIAPSPPAAKPTDAAIQILAGAKKLDGQTFYADANGRVLLPLLLLKNSGLHSTQQVSVRLYFSQSVVPSTNAGWTSVPSGDEKFPTELYSALPFIPISPGEPWSLPELGVTLDKNLPDQVKGKMQVFYGAEKPAEATFTMHRISP